jgi:putative inorganic carbon (HCO3(-)) transporter
MKTLLELGALLALIPALGFGLPVIVRRPALAVPLVCLSFPFGLTYVPFHLQVVDLMVLVAVMLVIFARVVWGTAPLRWTGMFWWLAALAAVAVLATPDAVDSRLATRQDLKLLTGLLFVVAIVAAARRLSDVRMILVSFLLLGSVVCLRGVLQSHTLTTRFGGAIVNNRVQGMFAQPNDYGSFSAAVLCVALGLALSRQPRSVRITACAVIPVSATALALSVSRGAFVGTGLAIVGLAVLLPRVRVRLLLVTIALFVIVLLSSSAQLGPAQLQVVGRRLESSLSGKDNPYDQRPAIWREAVRQIQQRPLLGYGPASFPESSAGADGISSASLSGFPDIGRPVGIEHAHNVLLTVSAELGLLAAVIVFGFTCHLALALWQTCRRLRGADAGLAIACAAGLLSFVGQGLVDFTLRNPMCVTPLYLITGCALACVLARPPGARSRPRSQLLRLEPAQ